ncbi:EAL domain-containing protein [Candidatus Nucleicultrix amoebiphila]|uniref:Diguanylate cyclase n=1 Tax=Candidatus Nucleicultrix amoebiphila FS5 TaxID=1414854 RepID=A0A1W6N2V2_9PROT|nr:EAL domain-containing protein [Candidatus Nucleicultrix amoebiphila]ARN84162.1 diguanylate cyclase [Candidatus Nucleicultrix amoebiphila FS5]
MAQEKHLRILIIDDNPEIHRDFIKILTSNRENTQLDSLEKQIFDDSQEKTTGQKISLPLFEIDTVSQGQEGVEYINRALKEGNPYSLAFVDIRMPPGWDGIETIKHIWELDRDIQIVICSAYSDYTWEDTVRELGTNDNLLILKKPFDNIAVRQLACALTKKWQLTQESRIYTKYLEKAVDERSDSLQQSLSLIRATLESSTDAILVLDKNESIVDYNNKLIEMWQFPQSLLETQNNKIILEYVINALESPEEFHTKLLQLREKPDAITIDVVKLKNGNIYERYSQPHKLNDKTIGRVWSFHDITRRAHLESKLEYQATHDALTNLPNRVLLMDRLLQGISQCERNNTQLAVLFFDLDRFKLINDSLNHEAGDELLKIISKRLKSNSRESDTLVRLGGDEFVLILTNITKSDQIARIARKLLAIIKEPLVIAKREIITTASIGICVCPKDGVTVEDLLRNADLAMYKAKESGGNNFQFYTPELNQQSLLRFERETELRHAIQNDEFFLCYQPQLNLETNVISGVEALIRWNHPKYGLMLPIDFIPFAEETGLIIPIGEWVLRTACKQNKAWQDQGYPKIYIAVNVANQQFRQPNFVSFIKSILEETGLEPQYLEIELTENIIIGNIDEINKIEEIKNYGIRIALDDFGTGTNTLNYLRKIPVDRLKIDQSFVHNIGQNRNDDVLIRAIISMANSLDLEVVAEGVETSTHLNFLKQQECQQAQGYYFSKPLIKEDIERYFKENIRVKSLSAVS